MAKRVKGPVVTSGMTRGLDNIPWKLVLAYFIHQQGLTTYALNYEEFDTWVQAQLGGGLGLKDTETGVVFSLLSRADVALMVKPTPERTM